MEEAIPVRLDELAGHLGHQDADHWVQKVGGEIEQDWLGRKVTSPAAARKALEAFNKQAAESARLVSEFDVYQADWERCYVAVGEEAYQTAAERQLEVEQQALRDSDTFWLGLPQPSPRMAEPLLNKPATRQLHRPTSNPLASALFASDSSRSLAPRSWFCSSSRRTNSRALLNCSLKLLRTLSSTSIDGSRCHQAARRSLCDGTTQHSRDENARSLKYKSQGRKVILCGNNQSPRDCERVQCLSTEPGVTVTLLPEGLREVVGLEFVDAAVLNACKITLEVRSTTMRRRSRSMSSPTCLAADEN